MSHGLMSGSVTASSADVPVGGIIMWSGTLASIPSGWKLCDGTSGTPDLRDKFIYGWSAGVDPGGTGGATTHTHDAHTEATVAGIGGGSGLLTGPVTHAVANHLPPYYKLAFIMKS